MTRDEYNRHRSNQLAALWVQTLNAVRIEYPELAQVLEHGYPCFVKRGRFRLCFPIPLISERRVAEDSRLLWGRMLHSFLGGGPITVEVLGDPGPIF